MLITTQSPIDLGQVKFGKPVNFSFDVKNTGNRPLQITKLWVGCSACTKATAKKIMIVDGGCTTIDVVFTPGSLGPQNKTVQVQWDGNQVLKLEFTAVAYE